MEDKNTIPMIGESAPSFHAETTQGTIQFPDDYKGKWVIFFSHPADFTPVCTTEFMTFASMTPEFEQSNVQLVGLSVDSNPSHLAWLRKIEEMSWNGIERPEIKFPLIADSSMEIAKRYGMIHDKQSTTDTVRAVFIIDPLGKIRAILYYPLTTGRNMQEIKRIVQALQLADQESIATPANWKPGDDVIIPSVKTMKQAKDRLQGQDDTYYCLDWFLCFKKNGKTMQRPKAAAESPAEKRMKEASCLIQQTATPTNPTAPTAPTTPTTPAMPATPVTPAAPTRRNNDTPLQQIQPDPRLTLRNVHESLYDIDYQRFPAKEPSQQQPASAPFVSEEVQIDRSHHIGIRF